jgi:cellulose synthase operon protein C
MLKPYLSLLILLLYCSSCSTPPPQDTLRSVDIHQVNNKQQEVFIKPKSEEEIKNAYLDYIKNAPTNDKSRRMAFNRLAEIELNRINQFSKKNGASNNENEPRIFKKINGATQNIPERISRCKK